VGRLVAVFRIGSSATAVVLLVAFNLLPLAGVLVGGWSVYTLLVLYWIENGIVGAFAVARILRADGPAPRPGTTVRLTGGTSASRLILVPFFIVHYGTFWAVHGIFVLSLPVVLGRGSAATAAPPFEAVAIAAAGLAISHGASFVLNYLGRREYVTTSPAAESMAPYGRVVILHMAIILGVFVSLFLGSPVGAVLVLVVLKTVVDLALHLGQHRPPAAATAPNAGTPVLPLS
jgi:hypothetical protein